MSGILFLGIDDFQLRQGDQGLLLTLTYDPKGLTLVLFYSKECPYCDNLINKFKQLPNYVNGCTFAMVNVNRHMSIVEKSKSTVAPITYVPDVILYVNGMPYVRYDGAHEIEHIKNFIITIYEKIQKTSFIDGTKENYQSNTAHPENQENKQYAQGQSHDQSQEIPAYTLGKPICGNNKKDGVCYLNFQKAYVSV